MIFQIASLNHKWSMCPMNLETNYTLLQDIAASTLYRLVYWSAGLVQDGTADAVSRCINDQVIVSVCHLSVCLPDVSVPSFESTCAYQRNQQIIESKDLPPELRARTEAMIWATLKTLWSFSDSKMEDIWNNYKYFEPGSLNCSLSN